MEEPEFEGFDADDLEPRPLRWPSRGRVLGVGGVALALVVLAVVPPLISMNRFRKQIASSVSLSLGRPVRIDNVALNVLPMPGFTLTTFVVGEDPAFGAEPVMRANTVRLTLRVSSLWRRRVEFSKITLEEPSVNVVHLADGRWNVESILLQAARMPAAPTGQKGRGDAPRIPYIEATGARVNLKMGLEKMPISLTEAKFSLWLSEPEKWQLRFVGKPTRTDGAPMDTGSLQVEGSLGKASTLQGVPVDLAGEWSKAPLGAVSWVTMGRDAGLRGEMRATARVKGTVGDNAVRLGVALTRLRRAEFVPERELEGAVACEGEAVEVFHRVLGVTCGGLDGVSAEGEVPDVFRPGSARGELRLKNVALAGVLEGLRVASSRISPDVTVGGTVSGVVACCEAVSGALALTGTRVNVGKATVVAGELAGAVGDGALTIAGMPLMLGGGVPAVGAVSVGRDGLGMELVGAVERTRVLEVGGAFGPVGDGLRTVLPAGDEVLRVDLVGKRPWGGEQVWAVGEEKVVPVVRGRKRRR